MPRAAQLSVRCFGHRWRGGSEMLGGLGQRLFEGLGVGLVLASLLVLLALLTYSPGDVSLNTAVDAPPRNFLGHNGALIADLLVQSVGLAAYLVPSVMFGWAFRLLLGHPIRRPGPISKRKNGRMETSAGGARCVTPKSWFRSRTRRSQPDW